MRGNEGTPFIVAELLGGETRREHILPGLKQVRRDQVIVDEAPRWVGEFKSTFTTDFTRTMMLLAHTTSPAQARNTVSLDPDAKDAGSLPAVRITFEHHSDDMATMKWILERQREILEAEGALMTWSQSLDIADNMPSRHLMGTCRMGSDPGTSVVNADSQTHDVPNL